MPSDITIIRSNTYHGKAILNECCGLGDVQGQQHAKDRVTVINNSTFGPGSTHNFFSGKNPTMHVTPNGVRVSCGSSKLRGQPSRVGELIGSSVPTTPLATERGESPLLAGVVTTEDDNGGLRRGEADDGSQGVDAGATAEGSPPVLACSPLPGSGDDDTVSREARREESGEPDLIGARDAHPNQQSADTDSSAATEEPAGTSAHTNNVTEEGDDTTPSNGSAEVQHPGISYSIDDDNPSRKRLASPSTEVTVVGKDGTREVDVIIQNREFLGELESVVSERPLPVLPGETDDGDWTDLVDSAEESSPSPVA